MSTRIKLTQPGWETFTGAFGGVTFDNGVSVEEIADRQAQRLSAIVTCERLEDGTNPSVSQMLIDMKNDAAPMEEQRVRGEESVATPAAPQYTREQLEAVAAEKGIAGMREIADKFEVKGTSIVKLIEAILSKQKSGQPQFIESVETVVTPVEQNGEPVAAPAAEAQPAAKE